MAWHQFDGSERQVAALQVVEVVRDRQDEVRPRGLRRRAQDRLQRGQLVEATLVLKQKRYFRNYFFQKRAWQKLCVYVTICADLFPVGMKAGFKNCLYGAILCPRF
jgi:hypothetical protein